MCNLLPAFWAGFSHCYVQFAVALCAVFSHCRVYFVACVLGTVDQSMDGGLSMTVSVRPRKMMNYAREEQKSSETQMEARSDTDVQMGLKTNRTI